MGHVERVTITVRADDARLAHQLLGNVLAARDLDLEDAAAVRRLVGQLATVLAPPAIPYRPRR